MSPKDEPNTSKKSPVSSDISLIILASISYHFTPLLYRFHSGSLAFGALIIAILQLIRAIFAYIKRKLKGREGSIGKALLCIFQCCLWCLEKFLKYINRQAYIEVGWLLWYCVHMYIGMYMYEVSYWCCPIHVHVYVYVYVHVGKCISRSHNAFSLTNLSTNVNKSSYNVMTSSLISSASINLLMC